MGRDGVVGDEASDSEYDVVSAEEANATKGAVPGRRRVLRPSILRGRGAEGITSAERPHSARGGGPAEAQHVALGMPSPVPVVEDGYSVTFGPGPIGLQLEPNKFATAVVVKGFARGARDEVLPAEAGGLISMGDVLVGVSGDPLRTASFAEVKRLIQAASRPVTLHFRRARRIPL